MKNKRPTFARYQKVETVLEAESAVKGKLGPKTEFVCKPPPSNERVKFARPVVYITEQFANQGLDHTMTPRDILRMALTLIQDGDGEFKIPESYWEGGPETEPEAPKKSKQDKKPEPAPVPAADPSQPVKRKRGRPRKYPLVVKPEASATPAAPQKRAPETVTPAAPAVSAPIEPSPAQRVIKPGFPTTYGVSVVTLLMTVDQIISVNDTTPGLAERQQKLADLIKDYQELTIIPRSGKEA